MITDVRKPLVGGSGGDSGPGNRVIFDGGPGGSYIENVTTGEKIYLMRKNGTFVMEIDVEDGRKDRRIKMDVGAADAGFLRQA